MIVYAIEFNPCIYESAFGIVRLYRDEKTAYKRIPHLKAKFHRENKREPEEWEQWRVKIYKVL